MNARRHHTHTTPTLHRRHAAEESPQHVLPTHTIPTKGPPHDPTKPDEPDWTLTPQQNTAVALLASGTTLTAAAEALGVTRPTVSEWFNHHPGFQAALNSRRKELWRAMTEKLRGLLPTALDVLAAEMAGETPLPAAIHVLKACGLYGLPAPSGPAETEDAVIDEQERQQERTATRFPSFGGNPALRL